MNRNSSARSRVAYIIVLLILLSLGSLFAGCSSPTGLQDNPLPKGGPQTSPRHPPGDVNSGGTH